MNKVVINTCYGGFVPSYKAYKWLIAHGMEEKYLSREYNDEVIESRKYVMIIRDENGKLLGVRDTKTKQLHSDDDLNKLCHLYLVDIPRHHPLLIQCVEELGKEASGPCSELEICEIEGNIYRIDEYDGYEQVVEPDGYDWIVIE